MNKNKAQKNRPNKEKIEPKFGEENTDAQLEITENSTPEKSPVLPKENAKPQPHNYGKITARIIIWIVFLFALAGLFLNPEIIANAINKIKPTQELSSPSNVSINNLVKDISSMRAELKTLKHYATNKTAAPNTATKNELTDLSNRLNNFETQNIALIDKKADKDVVLGIINRLDKLEQRLDNMAKISDQGALILSTAMMIKDSAARGNSYEYEAEMLSQLTAQEPQFYNSVRILNTYATQNIPSSEQLKKDFAKLYKKISEEETKRQVKDKNWKEVLNIKFQEYIKVKRLSPQGQETANSKELPTEKSILEIAKEEIEQKKFAQAIETLNAIPELLAMYPSLQEWTSKAEINIAFNQAIKQISTASLALMRLNYLQPQNTME